MLPPDLSWNPVSWRVMVFLVQLCGCFPFKISATDDPPVFSVYLFLWSVFVMFTTSSVHFLGYREVFLTQMPFGGVGTTIFVYTVLALMAGMTLSNVIMAMKSNNLANLLHDLSRFKGASPSPSRRWYSKPKTLAFTITLMITGIMMTWTTLQSMQVSSPCLAVFVLPTSFIGLVSFVLPMELPSMIFGLLVGHLVIATETAVARVSFLLDNDTDGSFKCEDKVKAAKEALGDLEALIREVEVKRERAARHFFPSISMFLLSGLMLGITSPYVMNVGSIYKSISLSSLLLGYYIMGRLCHMGQVFVNKISEAEELLKDLRVKCQLNNIKKEVSQVIGGLSPMHTFDMCGWYTLGYSQFLGFMNTVMTYLVIILQVKDTEETETNRQDLPAPPNQTEQGDVLKSGE